MKIFNGNNKGFDKKLDQLLSIRKKKNKPRFKVSNQDNQRCKKEWRQGFN